MTSHTRPSHVAEWAELVGDSVPDVVLDREEASLLRPSEGRSDSPSRWDDTHQTSPSNSQ